MTWKPLYIVFCLLLVTGCASGPDFYRNVYDQNVSPDQVISNSGTYINHSVLWGGVLISTENLESGTQLEVLAFPLQSSQRPDVDRNSMGRFVVISPDFLEPVDYAQGRTVTVTGTISEIRTGTVGSAEYQYPVIQSQEIHLWSKFVGLSQPNVYFGFGYYFGL